MLKYLLPMLRDRVVVAVALRRLGDELKKTDYGSRGSDLARALGVQVEKPLWEDVPNAFRQLPSYFLKLVEKNPKEKLPESIHRFFQHLQEIVEFDRAPLVPAPQAELEPALSDWLQLELDRVFRGQDSRKSPPAWRTPALLCIRMIRNEALAHLRWREWHERFNQLSIDNKAEQETVELEGNLRRLLAAVDKRVAGAGDGRRSRNEEVESMYQGVRLFIHSYLNATEAFRKRLRNPLGPLVFELVNDLKFAVPVASLSNPLLKLAYDWDKAGFLNAEEFLCHPWEDGGEIDSLPVDSDPLKIHLLLAVCKHFDSFPAATETCPDERVVKPLREFANRIGQGSAWKHHLVVAESDENPAQERFLERVAQSDVRESRRDATGVVLNAGDRSFVARQAKWRVPSSVRLLRDKLTAVQSELGPGDALLSELCGELADDLAGHRSLAEWLEAGDKVRLESDSSSSRTTREAKLWHLIHLANMGRRVAEEAPLPEGSNSHKALLLAFERHGDIKLEDGELPPAEEIAPFWFVHHQTDATSSPEGVTAMHTRRGLWITLPGRSPVRLAPPAVVVVSDAASQTSQAWRRLQPFLAELRLRDPRADIWQVLDEPVFRGLLSQTEESDHSALRDIFERVRKFALESSSVRRSLATKVLSGIRDFLVEHRDPLFPLLGPDLLTPLPAAEQPLHKLRVEWKAAQEPAGTLLEVARFGTSSNIGLAIASGGPQFPPHVQEYFTIPAGAGTDELQQRLETDREALAATGRDAATVIRRVDENLKDIVRWLNKLDDCSTLNAWLLPFVKQPRDTSSTPRMRWYQLMYHHGNLRTYPALDPANGLVTLPGDALSSTAALEWEFSDLPVGTPVEYESLVFSNRPDKVAGRFSMGPEEENSLLSTCLSLRNIVAADNLEIQTPPLAKTILLVAELARDRFLGQQLNAPIESRRGLFEATGAALEHLVAATSLKSEIQDQILQAINRLIREWDGTIIPEDWSFANPDSTTSQAELAFHASDAPSGLNITLGMRLGKYQKDCKLIRYVGPAPTGWNELNELQRQLPSPYRESFANILKEWPRSLQKRLLIQKVVELYIHWFDVCRPALKRIDMGLEKKISHSIVSAVKGQRLSLFLTSVSESLPANRTKYVEISYAGGGQTSEGSRPSVIREILRPGIQDESKEPLCKARIVMSEGNA